VVNELAEVYCLEDDLILFLQAAFLTDQFLVRENITVLLGGVSCPSHDLTTPSRMASLRTSLLLPNRLCFSLAQVLLPQGEFSIT